jgi:tetraacyldisaccharide-1-P 4'-kinase
MHKYKLEVTHDKGKFLVSVVAQNLDAAKTMVMAAEGCPENAIELIWTNEPAEDLATLGERWKKALARIATPSPSLTKFSELMFSAVETSAIPDHACLDYDEVKTLVKIWIMAELLTDEEVEALKV